MYRITTVIFEQKDYVGCYNYLW